ncbi:hypothetical protein DP491_22795, partial [Salmonella enterica]|nr:hypothetical protein [Salmonella enterica]EGW0169849.1 hypothetical protein [Salmonella enterica]MBE5381315.1 hypothetical protein [Salmonella enterica subsp. enterica serovar Enteritidis]
KSFRSLLMAVLLKSIFSIWAMKLTGLDSVLGDCFAHIFAQYNETIIVMNIFFKMFSLYE